MTAPTNDRDPRRELEFLRRRIATLARGRWASEVEDVAMEAWVTLDRVLRREPARNLDALMMRIARFRWLDFVASRGRDASLEPLDDEAGDALPPPPPPPSVDPRLLELVRFLTVEFFLRSGAEACAQLARYWFEGRNHAEIGREQGEQRNTIAKRWERCRRNVIEAFQKDLPGPLREFADELEELFA
jgi:DNA-directed RNA polymerase specialized sigma24 family protein